jgi:uncharacterized protein
MGAQVTDIASPCINVCTLDPATQVCMGCYRTIDEIAAWGSASNEQRAAILEELPRRRSLFARSENQSAMPAEWRPERCARCGTQFACGAEDSATPCWCTSYPPIDASGEARCLCPSCLAIAVQEHRA